MSSRINALDRLLRSVMRGIICNKGYNEGQSNGKQRYWFKVAVVPFLIAAILFTMPRINAQAQGVLTNGAVMKGSITDQTKILIYSYIANPGDLITAQVMGVSQGMNPTLSLLSPTQQQLATNNDDSFSIIDTNDARISWLVKDAGPYSFLVGGSNGDFVLRFSVKQFSKSKTLTPNTPVDADIAANTTVVYNFVPDINNPQNLSIASTTAGFAFTAQVYDPTGQLVAIMGNPSVLSVSLVIGPSGKKDGAASSSFQILISPLLPKTQGSVSILIGAAQPVANVTGTSTTATAVDTKTPTVTKTPSPTKTVPASATPGICTANPAGGKVVNVRSGPGTVYPVVGPLQPGNSLTIQGRSADGQWYVNTEDTNQSWVSLQVVILSGGCDKLPIIPAPPIPPTDTLTPSITPQVIVVTATPTATAKILVLPKGTATATPIVTIVTATPLPTTANP